MLKNGRQQQKSYYGGLAGSAFGFGETLSFYRSGSYDNTFPNISRIAESFMTILPYAVDGRGERLRSNPQLISALYNPNKEMSGIDFFEALMVMSLVHPTVYILCWHNERGAATPGGVITKDNIAGFTFLENPSVVVEDGVTVYRQGTQTWTENEVISISLNINPYSLISGYSPSLAAKKWATIDDYIADFQSGFFKNGAIPAGEFVITAKDVASYNATVDMLQEKHRGAGQNNNVVYVHRPTSAIDGKPMNAQIEWVPFSQANKDMTLQALFDQANKKIDMDFGVPQEIKGYLQNSNYASVNVAERIFDKYVTYPKALKIWSKFTHEMNRITGGLGFAISFDFDITTLADEEKVKAETAQVQFNTLNSALEAGFTLESAVKSLDLPESFAKLSERVVQETDTNVDIKNENKKPASQLETSTKLAKPAKKKIIKIEEDEFDKELRDEIEEYMESQIDAEIEQKRFDEELRSKKFAKDLFAIIALIILDVGIKQYEESREEVTKAGGDIEKMTEYKLSDELKTRYQKYLEKVSLSYTADTADSIKRVLDQAVVEGWSTNDLKMKLREIMNNDKWRVERLLRSEKHRAEGMAGLDAMEQLAKETGLKIYKTWHLNPLTPNPCDKCQELDGKRIEMHESFGDTDEDFATMEAADGHPNCNCYLTFDFEKLAESKIVKVTCPKCGRYMFESKGGNANNVICANSRCKKHFNFEIIDGKVAATEVKNG